MASFGELEDYYRSLYAAFSKGEESYHFNNDRSHNATVMRFMFDNSSQIDMYCGELSVLRESFYEHIEEDAEQIKDAVCESLRAFLDKKDARFVIILENYSDDIFKDLICEELFLGKMEEGQISLLVLDDSFSFKKDINHFCYTNSGITRFEENKNRHNAICVFHNKMYFDNMKNNFSILLQIAKNKNNDLKSC